MARTAPTFSQNEEGDVLGPGSTQEALNDN
jgi:hypothetical protein